MAKPSFEEIIKLLPHRRIGRVTGKLKQGPRKACYLDGIERGEQPFNDLATSLRIGRHQSVALFSQMEQDRAAFEDRPITVGLSGLTRGSRAHR